MLENMTIYQLNTRDNTNEVPKYYESTIKDILWTTEL